MASDPRVASAFEAENGFRLEPHLVVLAPMGSHSHGTYLLPEEPNVVDDVELMGFVVPPIESHLGLPRWQHWMLQVDEVDVGLYSSKATEKRGRASGRVPPDEGGVVAPDPPPLLIGSMQVDGGRQGASTLLRKAEMRLHITLATAVAFIFACARDATITCPAIGCEGQLTVEIHLPIRGRPPNVAVAHGLSRPRSVTSVGIVGASHGCAAAVAAS